MSSGPGDWFVRARGRVLGPFNQSQLVSMRDRGRLSQDHELSQDRRSWIKAAEVPGIFTRAADTQRHSTASADADWPGFALADQQTAGEVWHAAEPEPTWFIARGDTHQGPMSQSDVQRLINVGEVGPNSLIWKQGMPTWLAASLIPDFRFEVAGSGASALSPSQTVASNQYAYVPRTSGLAIASLVLGLLWLCGVGSLLATIFGAISLSHIAKSGGTITGKGLALAGLILGIMGLTSAIGLTIMFWFFGAAEPNG